MKSKRKKGLPHDLGQEVLDAVVPIVLKYQRTWEVLQKEMEGIKMDSFGTVLKNIRKMKNLSLRDVEKKSGISNSYLSQIEQGKRGIPSIPLLVKLDDALNLQRGDLCGYLIKTLEYKST